MAWWQRLFGRPPQPVWAIDPNLLPMPGWRLVETSPGFAQWQDSIGDVVSLSLHPVSRALMPGTGETALQTYCRSIAERQRAGLVEAARVDGADGPGISYIYKKPEGSGFKFFGVIYTPAANGMWMWMVLSGERGITGVREAIVAGRLLESGRLTPESYEAGWAQDPYDPLYRGVPKRTLRYHSDSAEYDAEFPNHPLSKVRRELARLRAMPIRGTPLS